MPGPSPETNTHGHPSDTHVYNTCLKHPHRYTHTRTTRTAGCVCGHLKHIHTAIYTLSPQTNTPCKHRQTHVCTALKTWMPTHIPLKRTQTDRQTHRQTDAHTERGARALCLLFRAAPVTFPSTRVHSQLLLLDLKMWGT